MSLYRCALEPVQSRAGQATVDALWATWHRLGLPGYVQADNAGVFYGSPAHPRGLGPLIRLCLGQGIEPWLIPVREPWRNGVVEKFNDHYGSKFWGRIPVPEAGALGPAHRAVEQQHNSRYRYSKLGGQTPLTALQRAGQPLRFPTAPAAPRVPLPKPETGCYHLVRFIRSDQRLDVFGERFLLPPEAAYAYVVATVDVAQQRLRVVLGADPVAEVPYRLRWGGASALIASPVYRIRWHIWVLRITWHLSPTHCAMGLFNVSRNDGIAEHAPA